MSENSEKLNTSSVQSVQQKNSPMVAETPPPVVVTRTKKVAKKNLSVKVTKQDAANTRLLQEQCKQLCLQLFFREDNSARSVGITSAIGGEGKSLLALALAEILAHDGNDPVTLIECNWEHPTLHECFGIPATPGLAEWLRGTCDETDIRYEVEDNLTVVPAGDGTQDAVKLLKQAQQHGLLKKLGSSNELLVVDLPAVITSSYGPLAASLVETVLVVVRSEVTPSSMLTETCAQLKDSSIHGIILNQENSRIPRWIQQLL
jgi:Mrp family chromosome partitioning ATPase